VLESKVPSQIARALRDEEKLLTTLESIKASRGKKKADFLAPSSPKASPSPSPSLAKAPLCPAIDKKKQLAVKTEKQPALFAKNSLHDKLALLVCPLFGLLN
jgi:hypothetical protein